MNPSVNLIQEIVMKAKQLIGAAVAVFALAPFAASADSADEASKEWFAAQKSTRSVQEVRAEGKGLPHLSDQHPVAAIESAGSTRSRAEVRNDLAKYGAPMVGA